MFRFQKKEPAADAVRRIARERIQRAADHLQAAGKGDSDGIHDARKRFKEIRAVLRLVRFELGTDFKNENYFYRDTGRALAEARDAQALIETWDKLLTRFPEELAQAPGATDIRRHLERRVPRVTGATSIMPELTNVVEGLLTAARRVDSWPLQANGFELLRAGVARTYRQGRRAMRGAYREGEDPRFHEWRKRVKDLWYHTKLLQPAWKDALRVRRNHLKRLADYLGDDHDLAVMRQLLNEEPELFASGPSCATLSRLIAARQGELRSKAYRLGTRLYAEKPKAYTRRIEAYWRAWRRKA